jgi:phosphatidate phosphatase APP1
MESSNSNYLSVKIYHGYGHAHNLIVFGHVFAQKPNTSNTYTNGVLPNILRLLRLFFVKPVAGVKVRLNWREAPVYTTTEADGFFKFEWQEPAGIPAGWHEISIDSVNEAGEKTGHGMGHLFVPHITQYGFISDIDDTVLVSHSATFFKKLGVMFSLNPHTRKVFPNVAEHYGLLALAQTSSDVPNPFYYVSSSEWNLYNDLVDFFQYNKLPAGVFLLNQIKKWHQLFKTGTGKYEGKLLRIIRIMEAFPNQQFILLGDNSQRDPSIYEALVNKYPGRVVAVYIRKVYEKKAAATQTILANIEKQNVHTCFFTNSSDAIEHSKQIGLIAA